MNVWREMPRAVPRGIAMAVRLWPWSLLAFALQFGVAQVPGWPVVAAFLSVVVLVVGAIIALRFHAAFLGADWRAVLADRAQSGRYFLWYCFLQVLGPVAQAGTLASHVPPAVALVCGVGASYFMLRLIAVLPAVVAWRAWPGIDRVWNAGGGLALRIATVLIALFLLCGFVLAIAFAIFGIDPHVVQNTLAAAGGRADMPAGVHRADMPRTLVLDASLALVGVLFQSIASAFAVRCFRVIEAARPSAGRG